MCRRPVGRMPLITRFVFASVPVANRSPCKFWRAAILPACRRRAAALRSAERLTAAPFDTVACAHTVKAGARLPHSKALTCRAGAQQCCAPTLQTQIAGDYQALDLAGAFV